MSVGARVHVNEAGAGGRLQGGGRFGSIGPVLWLFSHDRRHTLTDRYSRSMLAHAHTHTHALIHSMRRAKPLALEVSP